MQVSWGIDGGGESPVPACRRDSNHDHFVTWDTPTETVHESKSAVRLEKSLIRTAKWAFSDNSSLLITPPESGRVERLNPLLPLLFQRRCRKHAATVTAVLSRVDAWHARQIVLIHKLFQTILCPFSDKRGHRRQQMPCSPAPGAAVVTPGVR